MVIDRASMCRRGQYAMYPSVVAGRSAG